MARNPKPLALRSKLAQKRACNRLILKQDAHQIWFAEPGNSVYPAGAIILSTYAVAANELEVSSVRVHEDYLRCGLGTRLYELAAKRARDNGQRLVSDTSRSKCSDAFWQKQVKKGRAKCTKRVINPDLNTRLQANNDADYAGGCGRPVWGRSNCERYVLTTSGDSLAGRRKRR